MFKKLRTVVYTADDMEKAKVWYSELLGFAPYFDEPFYIGFNVNGFELGLMPEEGAQKDPQPHSITYWAVDNIDEACRRMQTLGCRIHKAIEDVGGGIRSTSLFDPFGNLLGLIAIPNE